MASTAPVRSQPPLRPLLTVETQARSSLQQRASNLKPQAGPLPVKAPKLVGEIGYIPPIQEAEDENLGGSSQRPSASVDVDGRHPAERSQTNLPLRTAASRQGSSHNNDSATSLHSNSPEKPRPSRLWNTKVGGVTLKAMGQFVFVLSLVGATIVGWIFTTMSVSKTNDTQPPDRQISPIFLHVLFAIVVLVLLVILERAIFHIRAERYAHMHPGEMLPLHRERNTAQVASRGMPLVPWNRPSLPTYAAALGFRGTGDVEDNIIAAPPPPAYGITRGSTLVLTTLIQNFSNTAQTNRTSVQGSNLTVNTASLRPISYNSSEQNTDIEHARILEATLSRAESNRERQTSSTN